MISTALLIIFFALVFAGISLLWPGAAYRREATLDHLFAAFWSGWALVIAALQVWQIFFRIDGLPLTLVILAGGLGWVLTRRAVLEQLRGWPRLPALVFGALALIPVLVVANHVMFVPPHTDHGLYHIQTVKWLSQYAIVPGLGNLHHRLAFNNANFLEAALLNAGPLFGRSYYLANTLLASVLLVQCAAGFIALLRQPQRPAKHQLYYTLMIAPVVWHLSTTHLPGYSPDVPVFALQVVLGGELLRLFSLGTDRARIQRQALYLVLLAAAGIAVKLSFVVFGALILLAVAIFWLVRFGFNPRADGRTWLGWAGLAGALILPWMLRGAVLSGYLFYPSTALPLPVAWKIPAHLAEPVAGIITLWARTASDQITYTGDLKWFFNWLRFLTYEARMSFIVSLLVIAVDAVLYQVLRRRCGSGRACFDGSALALGAISLLALVYWFIMAPDYRFSGAVFWIFLTAPIIFGYTLLTESQEVTSPVYLAAALALALTLWLSPNQFSKNFSFKRLLNPIPEPQLDAAWQDPSTAQQRQTASGLSVIIPKDNDNNCWNLPLPCVPGQDFTSQLHAFDPQHLQKGFFIRKDQPQ